MVYNTIKGNIGQHTRWYSAHFGGDSVSKASKAGKNIE